jgi:anti-anti-sigma factor
MDLSPRTLTIYRRAPGRYTLCGELDTATAHQLDELDEVHGPLLLNLRGVSFIDASGVSALVRLYERCPHPSCTFLIEECSPPAARVLRIVGLYELFTEDGHRPSADGACHETGLRAPVLRVERAAGAINSSELRRAGGSTTGWKRRRRSLGSTR